MGHTVDRCITTSLFTSCTPTVTHDIISAPTHPYYYSYVGPKGLTRHPDLALRILPACATKWVGKPEACKAAPAQPSKFIILQHEVGYIIIINGIIMECHMASGSHVQ